ARRGAGRDGGKDTGRAARPRDAGRASEARARPKEAARPAGPGEAAGHREEAGDGHVEETRPGDGRGEADATTAGEDVGPPAAILRTPPRGRRGLPLTLGPLTVHSLGVGGLGPGAILPLGYRSTRLFASARRPARRCLYTCRVVAGPRCEIVAEDEPGRVLAGPTPDVCHARLLQAL
ncbi:TBRG1 regulator, partial [Alcedo cyanopectus]|nr:TBRG1 regulator [Ceyx cyanopectus]